MLLPKRRLCDIMYKNEKGDGLSPFKPIFERTDFIMSNSPEWIKKSAIYHIYPLGFCGCERTRDEFSGEVHRIKKIIEWIPHLKAMSINAVYLGPVFESAAHGYDTSDYTKIDARLGTNEDFTEVCKALHENGIKIILDGVFNHVGREHFAFKDVKLNRERSKYCGWFCNLNFGGNTAYNDGFWYEGWNNCYDLVKLNLRNNEVVEYLLNAVKMWIETWDIDGIRFDAADCLDNDFIKRIHSFTRSMKPDFWLMGEIIHGDYRRWANPEMFDCVTNYQCYKGIYSSHNDRNYFEIAHSIEYQLGQYGNIDEDGTAHYYSKSGSAASGKYLNLGNDGKTANNSLHKESYHSYKNVQENAEPLYWQSNEIQPENNSGQGFVDYYILEISWNDDVRNDKETDMVYLTAGIV